MDNGKRMAIAIGLSAIILFLYMFYQSKTIKTVSTSQNINTNIALNQTNDNEENINTLLNTSSMQKIDYTNGLTNELNEQIKTLENEYVIAKFKNGALFSYELKNYYKQDIPKEATNEIVDMVGQVYQNIYPFTLTFQNLSNSIAVQENLNYNIISSLEQKLKYTFITIIKEAFANIIKHSNATKVDIYLNEHPAFYQLIVKDNGSNITYNNNNGIGLQNIKDRVTALNGSLNISVDDGFRIFISIPKS